MESFDQLEEQNTQKNIERVKDALLSDIDGLESIVGDWAPWDEGYSFVQDGNEAFIQTNLDPSTLPNLQVNIILFYNISGHLVYSQSIDIVNKEMKLLPERFQKDIPPNDIILNHTDINSSIKGIIILPEGPMIIASKPIITSKHEGPIKGTIIMGRFLDTEEIGQLSRIIHLSLNLSLFHNPNTPDISSAIKELTTEKPIFIQPMNSDVMAGYLLLNDIEGNPAIVIKAEMPRGIHKQGENTMRYLMIFIIGSGLVFGIVILLLLEKNVLSRLAFLSSNVSSIGKTGNHAMRISLTGNDELSNLANDINSMLEQLEKADKAKTKQLLLKEIYHRVKNNLQIVISLLNLQSQKTKDQKVIEIFKDSQNRIKSMALIHEKLYKSKDLAGINFKEYINDLVNNLFRSYGINSSRIIPKIDIEDTIMNLDTATPCGMIVTELVSNSLKHAFPAERKGDILIKLTSDNKGMFKLVVQDNGIGFPEDINFHKTDTLGMQLVTSLVGQIKGTIELVKNNGTEFSIVFKEKNVEAIGNE